MSRRTKRALYRREFKQSVAKKLRLESTEVERRVWSLLRNSQVMGLRFRRQQPIGPYIADYYCSAAKLVVELDGSQHGSIENQKYDERRDNFMLSQGLRVLRITNHEFLKERERVLENIWRAVELGATPLPGRAPRDRPSLKGRVEF